MVIKPGTHTLRIRYWVKDVATHVEGTITKIIPSHTFAKNEYVNMEADLQIKNYDGDHYYMWDAEEQYWKGYEWTKHLSGNTGQPTLDGNSSSNYAQNSSDANHRWYHEGSGAFQATQSCATLPNVNEMTWYAAKGDPHWDGDELWTTMGHLYKGGMWFKKKANISGYNVNTAVDGTDWRTTISYARSWSVPQTLPSVADAGNYFYLPGLGYYDTTGSLNISGGGCFWWSSSADPSDSRLAYRLYSYVGGIQVGSSLRDFGFRVGAFE